ncbi:hypothetical protein PHAVU_007G266400 [Phaseolus vulgaris]|uniref:START domain-containing protein n=1 Tax=Phaseolus vulgaris TaxID=3885 RepID=V7BMF3_PHAVU|nr:hypothetical protein PHAVU_007G266400g [Phaseolus vulgaris]ESW17766.1 hypothetical protein PHAVU_007G266400g [Phaseolus vulgaris]
MEKKRKIVQYRERLDRTLASPDLTNDDLLKKLVRSQLLPSLKPEVEGYKDQLVETKTAEVSHFLHMLRSVSSDDSGRSNTSHTDWKLKQDGEEFRVMYREGSEGSPFHTMLVEGFVDGPVDVCLCISWETHLYKKWWPQSTVPTFKILSTECLQKVGIGEQLSLVRMKVSWPLSMREAVVHYYLFEYFQDDLIVVLTNSVSDSKNVTNTLYGFNNEVIPEAKDVVRIDLVGGFVLQKVTSERSYFRTIANMDVKLDFVPPSLINFISRQLIGNGFRLYQKAVSSITHGKGEFSKALGDPLYVRIREALCNTSVSKARNGEQLRQVATALPVEDLVESRHEEEKDASKEDISNQYANNVMPMTTYTEELGRSKTFGEIVEVDTEEIVQIEENNKEVKDISIKEVNTSVIRGKRSVYISSEVEHALQTLDKVISMVREQRFHTRASSGVAGEETPFIKNDGRVDSYSLKLTQISSKTDAQVEVAKGDISEGALQEGSATNSSIQNSRYTGTNPNMKEVNSNKVVPTSSEQNLPTAVLSSQAVTYPLENEAIQHQTTISNKLLNTVSVEDVPSDHAEKSSRQKKLNTIVTQDMNSEVPKKVRRQKKVWYLFSALTKRRKS